MAVLGSIAAGLGSVAGFRTAALGAALALSLALVLWNAMKKHSLYS